VSEIKGWEKVHVQIDSGAIDSVGPNEVARAFALRDTAVSRKGLGFERRQTAPGSRTTGRRRWRDTPRKETECP
jgi:hypothetical protein